MRLPAIDSSSPPPALKEWDALDGSVKEVLRSQLRKRLDNPHVPGSRLHGGLANCDKIKLRKQGYRLVYAVECVFHAIVTGDFRNCVTGFVKIFEMDAMI